LSRDANSSSSSLNPTHNLNLNPLSSQRGKILINVDCCSTVSNNRGGCLI
jgi:hypothetical protein